MNDCGIYDKHIKKIRALNKKRGIYPLETHTKEEATLNPMSDFLKDKDGNPIPEGEARITKMAIFCTDEVNGIKAIAENGKHITLGKSGAKLEQVDRINGQWHIQNHFDCSKITRVRDKDMVLIKKLDRTETTNFEFWSAKSVGYNCFGPFVSKGDDYDYIVAKYETDNGAMWGYGKTLESARAFLGLKLFDEYKDIIHVIANRNRLKRK